LHDVGLEYIQIGFVCVGLMLLYCSLYAIYAKQKVSDNTGLEAVDNISNLFVARAL
jgi:hypothetical protein